MFHIFSIQPWVAINTAISCHSENSFLKLHFQMTNIVNITPK